MDAAREEIFRVMMQWLIITIGARITIAFMRRDYKEPLTTEGFFWRIYSSFIVWSFEAIANVAWFATFLYFLIWAFSHSS